MITIKLSGTPYELHSNWNDITYDKYCSIVSCEKEHWVKRLSVYTGIDDAMLNKLNLKSLVYITEIVSFMDSPEDVYAFAQPYESEINIGHESYGKLEEAKQAIKNQLHPIMGAAQVVKIYTAEEINQKSITEVMGCVAFFLTALESSWKNTSDLATMNPPQKSMKQVLTGLTHLVVSEQQQPLREETT
jgi:hypothetical protein